MRKLIVLLALSLSTSVAWAQAEKAQVVTKLPGEESLSTRERAERDFLMPVRRKKAADTLQRRFPRAPHGGGRHGHPRSPHPPHLPPGRRSPQHPHCQG
jgi:hypothetical protein